jgi:penicillin-binding protein 1A
MALLLCVIIAASLGLSMVALAATASKVALQLTTVKLPKVPPQPETTLMYDRRGKLLARLHAGINRTIVPLDRISPNLQRAVIAIEDRDFYREGGVSVEGTLRAAAVDLLHGNVEQGGSTITQQYVKLTYTGSERTITRKIREAILAEKVSHTYTKDEVLEKYLNTVYFGNGAYGAQAASLTYFHIAAGKLTTPQAALLAGLIQAPAQYDPYDHHAIARDRRNQVLQAMARQRYITFATARRYQATRLKVLPPIRQSGATSYFEQYVTDQLVREYGYDETFNGGLRVRTTLDSTLQREAEATVAEHLSTPGDPAAALVAIDPKTGAIRAMVGGTNFRRRKFNLATQAHRQTGSAFKVFTLTTAMDQGMSLRSVWAGPPSLTIDDPRCFDPTQDKPWEVSNYADESAGTMELLDATAHSVNTIFAQLVVKVGPDEVADMARRMGVRSKLQPVCSITLGSQPVTPLDMAAGYATLAADGVRHRGQVIQGVKDSKGKPLAALDNQGTRVITPHVARLVTSALQGVVQNGTGVTANIGRPVAGKTGTAQNFQDAWFCGYVPQLVTCVWVGYPKAETPMYNVEGFADVFGGSIPALIWHNFMAAAMEGQPVLDFPPPSDLGPVVWFAPSPSPSPSPRPEPSPSPKKCKKHPHHCH